MLGLNVQLTDIVCDSPALNCLKTKSSLFFTRVFLFAWLSVAISYQLITYDQRQKLHTEIKSDAFLTTEAAE